MSYNARGRREEPMRRSVLGDDDPHATFMLRLGDKVGFVSDQGTLHPEMTGTIVGGTCDYDECHAFEVYDVMQSDGALVIVDWSGLRRI